MKLKPTSTESIEETEKVTVTVLSTPVRESVFDAAKVSTLNRMINIAVYVQRFIKRIRKQNGCTREPPTVNERDEAEAILVREAQDRHFADIFKVKNKTNRSFVERLQVFKAEDGLLRCSGRIDHAELPWTAKNPILLPKGDPFTALVVKDYHERLFHAGVKHTLAELRYRFWVLSGRMELKKVISRCIVCKRIHGTSFRSPPQPPLPEYRVKGSRALSAVGLDYLGPVYIYSEDRLAQKTWICLFTCATTRAVHLEALQNMSAEHFLLAFRRFIAACGAPDLIVSDNAKTFIASEKAIQLLWKTILTEPSIQQISASNKIEWKFIVELSPWMGGFYERLVGIVKNSLKAALNLRRINFQELQTVITEIAVVVNSRPLMYPEDDIDDHPITPSHLTMRHRSVLAFPRSLETDKEYADKSTTSRELMTGWKRLQNMVDQFWDCWKRHYLISLKEQHRVKHQRNPAVELPQINMPVLIEEKNVPRGSWLVGRITELQTSSDGEIRSAKVRTSKGKVLHRPMKLLYPLEVYDLVKEEERSQVGEDNQQDGGTRIGDSELAQISQLSAQSATSAVRLEDPQYVPEAMLRTNQANDMNMNRESDINGQSETMVNGVRPKREALSKARQRIWNYYDCEEKDT